MGMDELQIGAGEPEGIPQSSVKKLYTQHDLKKLIERCFEECERNGAIVEANNTKILLRPMVVSEHITRTIIGELYELEILRKLGPLMRQQKAIESDMKMLEERSDEEWKLAQRRVPMETTQK